MTRFYHAIPLLLLATVKASAHETSIQQLERIQTEENLPYAVLAPSIVAARETQPTDTTPSILVRGQSGEVTAAISLRHRHLPAFLPALIRGGVLTKSSTPTLAQMPSAKPKTASKTASRTGAKSGKEKDDKDVAEDANTASKKPVRPAGVQQ